MRTLLRPLPAAALLAALLCAATARAQAPPGSVEVPGRPWADRVQTRTLDLIPPDGTSFLPDGGSILAYEESGYVLGVARDDETGADRPFLWFEGVYAWLPDVAEAGVRFTYADVSPNGIVAGTACRYQPGSPFPDAGTCRPVRWTAEDGLEPLGIPDDAFCWMMYDKSTGHTYVCEPVTAATAVAVNSAGTVLAATSPDGAARHTAGGWEMLRGGHEHHSGTYNSYHPVGLNEAGVAVGNLGLSPGENYGVRWAPGAALPVELDVPEHPDFGGPSVFGIADDGTTVGVWTSWPNGEHGGPYVWPAGATAGQPLPGSGPAFTAAINDRRDVYAAFIGNARWLWPALGGPVPVPESACAQYGEARHALRLGEGTFLYGGLVGPPGAGRPRLVLLRPEQTALPECPEAAFVASTTSPSAQLPAGTPFRVVVRLGNTGETPLWNVRVEEVRFEPAGGTPSGAGGPVLPGGLPEPLAWLEIAARDSLVLDAVTVEEGAFRAVVRVVADGPYGTVEASRVTFTVNDTGDEPDADLEDGICDTDPDEPGEQCTLRAAIETANAEGGEDRIVFDFSEAAARGGVATIALESPLPPLTEPVEIDAAPGASRAPGTRRLP